MKKYTSYSQGQEGFIENRSMVNQVQTENSNGFHCGKQDLHKFLQLNQIPNSLNYELN